MARELGGGVPLPRATPTGTGRKMPPSPRAFRAAQVSQGGVSWMHGARLAGDLWACPTPSPAGQPSRAGSSLPPTPAPATRPSLPAWRVPLPPRQPDSSLQPRGWDPGWGGRAAGTAPAADQLGWGRPRAARGPARRRRGSRT